MTKQYIVEKSCTLPLCCVDNDVYFDYMTGQIIDNPNTLNFIEEGLKRKSMKIEDIDLVIYEMAYEKEGNIKYVGGHKLVLDTIHTIVAYNYVINGCSNYLDESKHLLTNDRRQYIIDKLMKGEYEQVKIWE
ncbi:MAG: hypothetical protein KH135_00725 [Firmicutes bacterium]|nr:hypothetical protein [Bacillota bacterium]